MSFPKTPEDVQQLGCKRSSEAIEKTRKITVTCLKPFPRQVLGLLVRGIRMQNKRLCTPQGALDTVKHFGCVEQVSKYDN